MSFSSLVSYLNPLPILTQRLADLVLGLADGGDGRGVVVHQDGEGQGRAAWMDETFAGQWGKRSAGVFLPSGVRSK